MSTMFDSFSEDMLQDFVTSIPEPAHVKSCDGNYIFSNKANLEVYGLKKTSDLIGLKVADLDSFMKPFWGDAFANNIEKNDYIVKKKRKIVKVEHAVFLDSQGLIHIQNMVKTPLSNEQGKVNRVLTLSFELTHKKHYLDLFSEYKKVYQDKRKAIEYFIKYLGVDDVFTELLTEKELTCLIYLMQHKTYKRVARNMDLSVRTVETHISNVIKKSKLTCIYDITSLLAGKNR